MLVSCGLACGGGRDNRRAKCAKGPLAAQVSIASDRRGRSCVRERVDRINLGIGTPAAFAKIAGAAVEPVGTGTRVARQ